jgi:hypothetical protein
MTTTTTPLHEIIVQQRDGLWVFDDRTRDIVGEPFVDGMDDILDLLSGLPRKFESTGQITMTFSDRPAPTLTHELSRESEFHGGYYYRLKDTDSIGWLCPVTLQYFDSFPASLFVRIEVIRRAA